MVIRNGYVYVNIKTIAKGNYITSFCERVSLLNFSRNLYFLLARHVYRRISGKIIIAIPILHHESARRRKLDWRDKDRPFAYESNRPFRRSSYREGVEHST